MRGGAIELNHGNLQVCDDLGQCCDDNCLVQSREKNSRTGSQKGQRGRAAILFDVYLVYVHAVFLAKQFMKWEL